MVEIPETRYARNGPVSIAYQIVGRGPMTVVYAGAGATHLDYSWRHPPVVRPGLGGGAQVVELPIPAHQGDKLPPRSTVSHASL